MAVYELIEKDPEAAREVFASDVATKVSIVIMAAFVAMRKYISSNLLEQKYINNMVLDYNSQVKLLHSKAVYHCGQV